MNQLRTKNVYRVLPLRSWDMGKKLLWAGLAAMLLVTMVFGAALAQGVNPPAPDDEYRFDSRFPLPWGGMEGRFLDGQRRLGGMFGGPWMDVMNGVGLLGIDGDGWKVYDAVAAALKLTPTQLFEQLHAGRTLEQIASAQGVKMADLEVAAASAAREAMRARIDRAVEEGKLTREQADRLLERLEGANPGKGLPRGGFFRNWRFGEDAPWRGLPFFRGRQMPEFSF
jgi:hypothetical protein